MPIAELAPAPYNPRKDLKPGDREYESLKRSIQEFGVVDPVIFNTRTQRLVGGRPAAIDDPLVVIGGFDTAAAETYEARCHRHHEIGAPRSRNDQLPDAVDERAPAGG